MMGQIKLTWERRRDQIDLTENKLFRCYKVGPCFDKLSKSSLGFFINESSPQFRPNSVVGETWKAYNMRLQDKERG